jgi:protein tyrosine/serine phosphatase
MINTDNLREVLKTDIKTPIPETTVSKIISLPPFITVPGVSNFRDLSHDEKLRAGYIYRSGNLSDITEEGKTILAKELGITTIFDLRNEGERLRAPSPVIEGVDTIWMPYGARPASLNLRDFAGEDTCATGFVKMYNGILDAATPAFSQVFSHIRDQPNDPFIFHCSGKCLTLFLPPMSCMRLCRQRVGAVDDFIASTNSDFQITAGKDRTGVLAALVLLLIGRTHDDIINDYILTRIALENVRENLTEALAIQGGSTEHLSPEANGMLELSSVRAQAMAAFLKSFENTYKGGVEEFLSTKLGFSPEDVQNMRHNLTDFS